jgi:hypothetical protein
MIAGLVQVERSNPQGVRPKGLHDRRWQLPDLTNSILRLGMHFEPQFQEAIPLAPGSLCAYIKSELLRQLTRQRCAVWSLFGLHNGLHDRDQIGSCWRNTNHAPLTPDRDSADAGLRIRRGG